MAIGAFLMPWAVNDGLALRGYRLSPQLTICILMAVVLRQIVLTVSLARPDIRSRGAIVAIHVGGMLGVAVGVPAISPTATHDVVTGAFDHPASLVFLLALVLGTLCGVRAAEAINDASADVDLLGGLHRPTAAAVEEGLESALDDALAAPGAPVHEAVVPALLPESGHHLRSLHTGWAAPNRPRLRLGRATFALAVLALVCTRLSWILPADRVTTFAPGGLGDGLVPTILGLVTVLAAWRLTIVIARPCRNVVVTATALTVAAFGAATSLSALVTLGSARVHYVAGPAGWLTLVLFGGVAALAMFTTATVYESWREWRRGSSELALAAARLEPALRPHRMW